MQNPEDTNLVGTEHTITIDVFVDDFGPPGTPWEVNFEIIDGPNQGLVTADGDCDPCSGFGDGEANWTYESNGDPGTDVIQVCVTFIVGTLCSPEPPAPPHVIKHWVEPTNTPRPTNTPLPTATFPPTFAGQIPATSTPTRIPPTSTSTVAPPAPTATTQPQAQTGAISPPSTGDAGLAGSTSRSLALAIIAAASASLGVAGLVLRRTPAS